MKKDLDVHYVVIVDSGIGRDTPTETLKLGKDLDIFMRSPQSGFRYNAKVWPGASYFPDWFHPKIKEFWQGALEYLQKNGVEYSGIWLDMYL